MTDSAEPHREKRGNARRSDSRPVRLEIPEQLLEGMTRDLSGSGAFVLTGDGLRIVITRASRADGDSEAGDGTPREARLVRFETLPGGGVGLALEFIDDQGLGLGNPTT